MTDGLPPLPHSPVPALEPPVDPELRVRLEALVGATSLAGRLDAFVRLLRWSRRGSRDAVDPWRRTERAVAALLPSPREDHDPSGLLRPLFPTDAEVERLDRQPQAPTPARRGGS